MSKGNIPEWLAGNFTKDLVSVIVPTYNRIELLGLAIQSILDQNYRPIECIVVDDGSTQDVYSVIDLYQEKEAAGFSITYVHQKNAGAQIARNKGTNLATGEFIQYLDSDDVLYTDKISQQVSFLKSREEYDAVFGNWHAGMPLNKVFVKAYANEDLIGQLLTERCIANFSILMRRSLVQKIGPWDISIKRNQEIDYHLRGILENGQYAYLNHETGLLRTHQGERISTITSVNDIIDFYTKWKRILADRNMLGAELKRKIAAIYFWHFFMNIHYGASTLRLLRSAMELDPGNALFSSRKFKSLATVAGKKTALKLWLRWLIYNRKNQQALLAKNNS